jgi:hypothetical protein
MIEARLSADLPENFALLYDYKTGKFDTPLDSRGIADVDAIFELAIRTFPDELPEFDNTERNRHHVYWTESKWKNLAEKQTNPEDKNTVSTFRNSPPQVAYVPMPIHAWIEYSQIPPPAPSLETMRLRNTAWMSAMLLLKSAVELDKARDDYKTNRLNTRTLLGNIVGITPVSRRRGEEIIEELDTEYWLSELNSRLDGWRNLADTQPEDFRFLEKPKLADVRKLRSRIREDAIVPRLPAGLIAA